jgi:hypothetical protein
MARSSTPSRPVPDPAFAATWNATDKARRKQIRRLVRNGRLQESVADARLAAGFAAYQRSRPWYRFFWLWLPIVTVGALVAASLVHPLVIGMVLAVAGNGIFVRRNFRRADIVNAEILGQAPSQDASERSTSTPRAKKRPGKPTSHAAAAAS